MASILHRINRTPCPAFNRAGRDSRTRIAPPQGFGLCRLGVSGDVGGILGQGFVQAPVPLGAVGVPKSRSDFQQFSDFVGRGRIVQQRFHVTSFAYRRGQNHV